MKEVPKAKRNALAANRLQWGIIGVPPKIDSAGSQDSVVTDVMVEAQETPAVDITEAEASASGEQTSGGRLGAKLEELIRQARAKAASKAAAEELKVGGRKAAPAAGSTRLQLPGFQLASFGFAGRWKEAGASYMLYPPKGVKSKAVVHFLGGAFVGAAPHISYRYMLEDLADQGYIIITTPYNLIFNYVDLCAGIVQDAAEAFSQVPADLPMLGVGHSCGSLLHTLLPVLFPEECPRMANVLISWNNKPAKEAIPQFEEVVIPFVNALLDKNDLAASVRENLVRSFEQADDTVSELAASQFAPLAVETELLPLTRQGLKIVEQVPDLLERVNNGEREFVPTVSEVAQLIQRFYPVPASLVVSFDDDSLDESNSIEALLRLAPAATTTTSSSSSPTPSSATHVQRTRLKGSHITPLTQDVFISTPLDSFDPLLPLRKLARQELLRPVDALNKKLVPFLDAALARTKST